MRCPCICFPFFSFGCDGSWCPCRLSSCGGGPSALPRVLNKLFYSFLDPREGPVNCAEALQGPLLWDNKRAAQRTSVCGRGIEEEGRGTVQADHADPLCQRREPFSASVPMHSRSRCSRWCRLCFHGGAEAPWSIHQRGPVAVVLRLVSRRLKKNTSSCTFK